LFLDTNADPKEIVHMLRLITSVSVDIDALASDIYQIVDMFKNEWYRSDISFTRTSSISKEKSSIDPLKAVNDEIIKDVARLKTTDQSVKNLLLQQGNMASATENMKLQSKMFWLTVVMTALTIATAVLAGLSAYQQFLAFPGPHS
jgi:hypothetical protein